jgi:hypothetical protein
MSKGALLSELRRAGVFLWHNGAIDDYYPAGITGPDKPSRVQNFRKTITARSPLVACCSNITCAVTNQTKPEFEFLADFIAS